MGVTEDVDIGKIVTVRGDMFAGIFFKVGAIANFDFISRGYNFRELASLCLSYLAVYYIQYIKIFATLFSRQNKVAQKESTVKLLYSAQHRDLQKGVPYRVVSPLHRSSS